MGTARSVFFTVSSFLMIAAGITGIVISVMTGTELTGFPGSSTLLTVLIIIFVVSQSIFDLISGIRGALSFNKRTNSAVVIRLPELSIACCILALIFSAINGIMISYMIIIFVCGILIPVVFIVSAIRKSYT